MRHQACAHSGMLSTVAACCGRVWFGLASAWSVGEELTPAVLSLVEVFKSTFVGVGVWVMEHRRLKVPYTRCV